MTKSATLTFTDRQWAGITAAREARNADLGATIANPAYDPEVEGSAETMPNPDLIATNEAYLQFVAPPWADSYCGLHADRVAEILAGG